MGPLPSLLNWGATVAAVDLPGSHHRTDIGLKAARGEIAAPAEEKTP